MFSKPKTTARVCHALKKIDEAAWDRLLGEEGSPFLEWSLLNAFESAGCVSGQEGWAPHHLLIERGKELLAAAPMYLKGHSAGEFVFDHQWADAAYRLGIDYYPKAVVAVPFTPVTGTRILTHPDEDRDALTLALAEVAWEVVSNAGLSSLHWLFMPEAEARQLAKADYAIRFGIQYHWHNRGYDSFDDWLNEFKSKQRRNIRRERKAIAQSDVELRIIEGDDITPQMMDLAFDLYLTTIDKKIWGRQYLNRTFFKKISKCFKDRLMLILAYRDERPIAGSLFVHKDGAMLGRYWGCFEDVPFLHFEVCYYKPVELCIERGWKLFEAGAQGHHKYKRGFAPILTYSAHRVADPRLDHAVRRYLHHEREATRRELELMRQASPSREVQALAEEALNAWQG